MFGRVRSLATASKAATAALHPYVPQLFSPPQVLDSIRTAQETKKRGFVESVELALTLKLDAKKSSEQIRIVSDLPFGTGKDATRVCAFTLNEEQALAAKAAGCDLVGGLELIDEIVNNPSQINFEKCVCTPDIHQVLSQKLARVLGPKGLMPSKKLNTITSDLAFSVKKAKAGEVSLRLDRGGTVHCAIGSLSLSNEQLLGNLKAILLALENNKPLSVKGKKWVKTAFMKSTMGQSHALSEESIDPKHSRFMV